MTEHVCSECTKTSCPLYHYNKALNIGTKKEYVEHMVSLHPHVEDMFDEKCREEPVIMISNIMSDLIKLNLMSPEQVAYYIEYIRGDGEVCPDYSPKITSPFSDQERLKKAMLTLDPGATESELEHFVDFTTKVEALIKTYTAVHLIDKPDVAITTFMAECLDSESGPKSLDKIQSFVSIYLENVAELAKERDLPSTVHLDPASELGQEALNRTMKNLSEELKDRIIKKRETQNREVSKAYQ